jgi:hypothetical protein
MADSLANLFQQVNSLDYFPKKLFEKFIEGRGHHDVIFDVDQTSWSNYEKEIYQLMKDLGQHNGFSFSEIDQKLCMCRKCDTREERFCSQGKVRKIARLRFIFK